MKLISNFHLFLKITSRVCGYFNFEVFQEIFKKLKWDKKCLRIDSEFINHTTFTDIVSLASLFEQL